MGTRTSFCRYCPNSCPVLVEVDDGVITSVRGDPENEVFGGYLCVKGAAAPAMHRHPKRLLHSMKRRADGTYQTIEVQVAIEEIAERLQRILGESGPRAVASYFGTAVIASPFTEPFVNAFMQAIGSRRCFTPNTIDKPGKQLAAALHGTWMAPLQGYDEPDVALIVGANPYKSYFGVACGNPGTWLGQRRRAGMQLIVIDPRRTDLAKRATLHLQPVPGQDVAILACLINVILAEGLYDRSFVHDNTVGLATLAEAVQPFAPDVVARRADVAPEDLVAAARTFAADRGYLACGVGPGFSASTTLVEYLALNLETLCGHWLRAGEAVRRAPTLLPPTHYKAQAAPPRPAYGFGEQFRTRALTETAAGMPTGILADEILTEGDGQIRALFSVAGNPVSAWPDQLKVIEAMRSLDLLVQIDPWMSATARQADYVIAPRMPYESVSATLLTDKIIATPTYYGPADSYAQYSPAVAEPPEGSEVVAEWEFFYRLAQCTGKQLHVRSSRVFDRSPTTASALDMSRSPTEDELLETLTDGSRVPLDVVKRYPHGATFVDPLLVVADKDPEHEGRLDLGNPDMMADLRVVAIDDGGESSRPDAYPMRLISRRLQHVINSSLNDSATNRGRGFNPAYLHPSDLDDLGVDRGDVVRLATPRSSILAVAEPDDTLRPGLVAMAHGFGDAPDRDDEFREIGSPVGRLLDNTDIADRYVGMPRMSNIPVRVELAGDVADPPLSTAAGASTDSERTRGRRPA